MRFKAVVASASILAFSVSVTDAAFAACTRLSFSVNDYGKDGPTKDAKDLLDKYATKWTSDRGIKKFSVGTKEVSCALFLNFIVFDEHTCTATANVCWEGNAPVQDAKNETPLLNKAAAKVKPSTTGTAANPPATTTGSVKPAPAVKTPPAPSKASVVVAPSLPAIVVPSAPPMATTPAAPAAVAPAASGN